MVQRHRWDRGGRWRIVMRWQAIFLRWQAICVRSRTTYSDKRRCGKKEDERSTMAIRSLYDSRTTLIRRKRDHVTSLASSCCVRPVMAARSYLPFLLRTMAPRRCKTTTTGKKGIRKKGRPPTKVVELDESVLDAVAHHNMDGSTSQVVEVDMHPEPREQVGWNFAQIVYQHMKTIVC